MAEHVCEQLREAVTASGMTLYRVARQAGIRHEVLARFMRRERDIRGETFAKIAAVLGLELRPADTAAPVQTPDAGARRESALLDSTKVLKVEGRQVNGGKTQVLAIRLGVGELVNAPIPAALHREIRVRIGQGQMKGDFPVRGWTYHWQVSPFRPDAGKG
jgi:transcriptional regulator with XRE-family HTH domain